MKKIFKFVGVLTACMVMLTSAVTAFAQEIMYKSPLDNYFYSMLSPNGKTIYKAFYSANLERPTVRTIEQEGFDTSKSQESIKYDLGEAMRAFSADHPEVFWLPNRRDISWHDGGGSLEYTVMFKSDFESFDDVETMRSKIDKAITSLVKGNTHYEKIRSIHDGIINNADYDIAAAESIEGLTQMPDEYAYSTEAYGVLVKGKGVCSSYANAVKMACDYAGIPCIIVSGTASNSQGKTERHAWNYIQMEDGKWYMLDATWDDPITQGKPALSYNYFLIGSDKVKKHVSENIGLPILSKSDYVTNSNGFVSSEDKMAQPISVSKFNATKAMNTITIDLSKANGRQLYSILDADGTVTVKNFQDFSAAAKRRDKSLELHFDTVVGEVCTGRLTISGSLLDKIDYDIATGIYTNNENTAALRESISYFYSNRFAAVDFEHKGEFPAVLRACARVSSSDLDIFGSLHFYNYDFSTNKLTEMFGTAYTVDKNNFVHFNVSKGNTVVISEGPLKEK